MFELKLAQVVSDTAIECSFGQKAEVLSAGRGGGEELFERLERGIVGRVEEGRLFIHLGRRRLGSDSGCCRCQALRARHTGQRVFDTLLCVLCSTLY